MNSPPIISLENFPARSTDKLRYADTDRQGHVNNAMFATFFETGRVEMMETLGIFARREISFVIARLTIDFRREILWPGAVCCGTGVSKIGNTSFTMTQTLFQEGVVVATAESVVVQIDNASHRATPLGETLKVDLQAFVLPA